MNRSSMPTYQWIDALVSGVIVSGSIVLHKFAFDCVESFANAVDLLVDLGTMVVALLTGTCNGELHAARMPSTNTSDLAQALVRFARQLLGVPTRSDTFVTFTLGHTDAVDQFVLVKHVAHVDFLFEVSTSPVNLLRDCASVHLHFHDVRLLLAQAEQLHLGVSHNTNDAAILLDASQILFNLLLAGRILPLLGRLGERLLLRISPNQVKKRTQKTRKS